MNSILIIFLVFVVSSISNSQKVRPTFIDVSAEAGMVYNDGKKAKYSGPAIADINGDGYLDLIFSHHNHKCAEVYINNANGSISFSRSKWEFCGDVHGINPIRFSPLQSKMHFLVSRGGFLATRPNHPLLYSFDKAGEISRVDDNSTGLIPKSAGRGRSALFVHMDHEDVSRPSILITNAKMEKDQIDNNKAFELLPNETFRYRELAGGIESDANSYASVIDINQDGFMEILTFQDLNSYEVKNPFNVVDIKVDIFPRKRNLGGTSAVAEFDYDNDGLMDLYVARTDAGHLRWRKPPNRKKVERNDKLFRNVGGKFVEVSIEAGIPLDTQSQGVTSGDFNNDGWTDLFINRNGNEPDLFLMNNGDGTFSIRNANINREKDVNGDMAVGADLDRDGKLDLVISEGHWSQSIPGVGYYRIMKNITPNPGNYLLVKVGNSPSGKVISLHAMVRVKWKNSKILSRRVGGSSGTAVSVSYIELLHFGLGGIEILEEVSVRWVGGEEQRYKNVKGNQLVTFGI